jgi:hypothetical protein
MNNTSSFCDAFEKSTCSNTETEGTRMPHAKPSTFLSTLVSRHDFMIRFTEMELCVERQRQRWATGSHSRIITAHVISYAPTGDSVAGVASEDERVRLDSQPRGSTVTGL